jgi:hypothetical protein
MKLATLVLSMRKNKYIFETYNKGKNLVTTHLHTCVDDLGNLYKAKGICVKVATKNNIHSKIFWVNISSSSRPLSTKKTSRACKIKILVNIKDDVSA